jgi:hypothetical protein
MASADVMAITKWSICRKSATRAIVIYISKIRQSLMTETACFAILLA